jgi:hypothetical protein
MEQLETLLDTTGHDTESESGGADDEQEPEEGCARSLHPESL